MKNAAKTAVPITTQTQTKGVKTGHPTAKIESDITPQNVTKETKMHKQNKCEKWKYIYVVAYLSPTNSCKQYKKIKYNPWARYDARTLKLNNPTYRPYLEVQNSALFFTDPFCFEKKYAKDLDVYNKNIILPHHLINSIYQNKCNSNWFSKNKIPVQNHDRHEPLVRKK